MNFNYEINIFHFRKTYILIRLQLFFYFLRSYGCASLSWTFPTIDPLFIHNKLSSIWPILLNYRFWLYMPLGLLALGLLNYLIFQSFHWTFMMKVIPETCRVHHIRYLRFIDFPISWLWTFMMKVIPETCRVHYIRYLRFYDKQYKGSD